MELATALPVSWTERAVQNFATYLSGQSELPWSRYTWLGNGHTVGCDVWKNKKFKAALLCSSHPSFPRINLGTHFGDPVNLLWLLPITEQERLFAVEHSSAKLLEKLPNDRWQDG